MTITEVTVGMVDTFKLGNYEYIKPEIRVTAKVEKGESADEVIDKLEDYVINEIRVFIKKRLDSRKRKS